MEYSGVCDEMKKALSLTFAACGSGVPESVVVVA